MKNFLNNLSYFDLEEYKTSFEKLVKEQEDFIKKHGRAKCYLDIIKNLPEVSASHFDFNSDKIQIGKAGDINEDEKERLFKAIYEMRPWRKGPYEIFGLDLDAEWAANLKWNRLKKSISSLKNRKILDIGSNSGYYLFKMLSSEPKIAIGIEPYLHFYFQFLIISNYVKRENLFCLPFKFEVFPETVNYFDTVFCMGILYHSRSPIDMLKKINNILRKDGELIIETLIIEGDGEVALFPEKRYAKMNNVYFLPTVSCLENWLKRSGFTDIKCIDISKTTEKEQRKTKWVNTESLDDFLSPEDKNKTTEGYPAPVRAMLIAKAK